MANYATLIAAIQAVIKANGNNEITGPILQSSLLSMISSLGYGYQFVGIADPNTNPGNPDQKVFYLAKAPGLYANFGGYNNTSYGWFVLYNKNGSWEHLSVDGAIVPFEFGGVSASTGALPSNTIRMRTKAVYFSEGTGTKEMTFTVPAGFTYSSSYAYLGTVPVKAVPDINVTSDTVTFTADGTFDNIRMAFTKSGAEISQSEVDASFIVNDIAQAEINRKDIASLKVTVDTIATSFIYFEYGGVSASTGALPVNTIRMRSKPVYFSDGLGTKTIKVTVPAGFTLTTSYAYLGLTAVEAVPDFTLSGDTITFTADGNFDNIRVSFMKAGNVDITEEEVAESYINSDISQIELNCRDISRLTYYGDLKYCALGDSITYGFIPRNYAGYPGQLDSYAKLCAEYFGFEFENWGVSGSTVAQVDPDDADYRNPMVNRYYNMPNDADIITVMGGTNDIRQGVPLGTMADRTKFTFYGALHTLFQGLYTKYIGGVTPSTGKKKVIAVITPIKLLDASKSHLANSVENNADILQPDFDLWVYAIKEVAAFYSFPVLDFYNISGINPHLDRTLVGTESGYTGNYNNYITDGTHPTQEGQDILARVAIQFFKDHILE